MDEETFDRVAAAAGGQQAVRRPEHEGPVPAAGPGRLRVLRLRLLPHLHDHDRAGTRSTTTGASAPTTTATRAAASASNKPVRADYADKVVWDHVTALLADPSLIRAEIGKRLERARTSDPVTRKRGQLEQALAKTTTSIAAMITAFSEQLITIDELRARMPDLRARETGLKDQIAALDAQAADRDAYLKLADDLEGFLARLRSSSATATTEDRQRVLRAVVQDVLIGPEKITIRHRIPARNQPAAAAATTPPTRRVTCAIVRYCVGGVLSPLLSNVALSVLDEHIDRSPGGPRASDYQRSKRRAQHFPTTGWSGTPTTGAWPSPGPGRTRKRCKRKSLASCPRWACAYRRKRR